MPCTHLTGFTAVQYFDPNNFQGFSLSNFEALSNFELTMISYSISHATSDERFKKEMINLSRFFARETERSWITTISLNIYTRRGLPEDVLQAHPMWAALDSALANPVFVDLMKVNINFKSCHHIAGTQPHQRPSTLRGTRFEANATELLPCISGFSWLTVKVQFEFLDYLPVVMTEVRTII